MSLLTLLDSRAHRNRNMPNITIKALLIYDNIKNEGALIKSVAFPWFSILNEIRKNPNGIYQFDSRTWEEIIAGAYRQAGFDEVILTPRSGDKGRDVVATKKGIGSIRIFDQVKAYKPGHVVTADEVRSMIGVITGAANVSKGIITTTSVFAPRINQDEFIKPFIPFRLELKPKDVLLVWLNELYQESQNK